MNTIINFISVNGVSMIIALFFLVIIFAILTIIILIKLLALQKKYNTFIGDSKTDNIESLLISHMDHVTAIDSKYDIIKNEIIRLNEKSSLAIQKMGMVRYNPFEDVGGNLCYALALLNAKNNGVLINSIYSREGSYNYGKPILNGTCEYNLSKEEQEALDIALNK